MFKVYLAGPIQDLSYGEATEWRVYAKRVLGSVKINGYSPMRDKDYLSSEQKLGGSYDQDDMPMSTGRGVITRDFYDVESSDAVLVYLLGATQISVGTVCEIAWAWQMRKPLVLVMEKTGNVHDHVFIKQMYGFRVDSLDLGLNIIQSVLLS